MARCAQVGKLKKEISHKEKTFHSKEGAFDERICFSGRIAQGNLTARTS